MTRLERLTARYWRASTHLRRRQNDPDLADWEAWGLLAALQQRRSYPRLARAAEDFLFPRQIHSDEDSRNRQIPSRDDSSSND